jgi:Cd2+/Zn2+-exporting ATPase
MNNKSVKRNLDLDGMDCSDCALVIQHRLERLDGVLEARANYGGQTVQVEYDPRLISQYAIERRIQQLGYQLVPGKTTSWYRSNRPLFFSLLGGMTLLLVWLGGRYGVISPPAVLALYLVVYFLSGYEVVSAVLHSLRRRHFDIDLLMLAAALGAALIGDLAEGALLLFLFSLGHTLQERSLDRARKAVRSLGELAPKAALVKRNGIEESLPVEQLVLGDVVMVRPGERFPVDGEVLVGSSAVDQSPITGESMPVEKAPSDQVLAGSVNGEGALKVRVTRLARDSTLARVMKMVEQAQASRSPTHQAVERFTRILTPLVLLTVFLLMVIPPLIGEPFSVSFLRAVTVLVAASPCALALGTPSAIMAGIALAARNGVLVKGGVHLENLGRLRLVAFDKTGTLTNGEPRVTDVLPRQGWSVGQVLSMAAALEGRSEHPLAKAILREAACQEVSIPEAIQVKAMAGRGLQADVKGQRAWIGSPGMFLDNGVDPGEELNRQIEILECQGKSMVLVGLDKEVVGLIAVEDAVRPEAASTLKALSNLGVEQTVMLSGDNLRSALHVASQLGIDQVRAGLMPEDKLQAVRQLLLTHHTVGMVGDGINDAPALALATVGIAMGGAGSAAALETADVALMASDLTKLPLAVGLGRATQAIILQNLIFSLVTMLVLSGLALASLSGIGLVVLLHEGSTLIVVLNAMRLLVYRKR